MVTVNFSNNFVKSSSFLLCPVHFQTRFFIFSTFSGVEDIIIAFKFATITRNSISRAFSTIHCYKFIISLCYCKRKTTKSHAISIYSALLHKIWAASKTFLTKIIKRLSTEVGSFNDLLKSFIDGYRPKQERSNSYNLTFH